jgi:outer membrane protein
MRAFTVAAALGFALVAASTSAQERAQQPPAQQQPPPPPAQKPATPPPAQPPPTAPVPQPPRPFPEGAKVAYINIQRIAQESDEGKASTAKVKALNDKKVAELGERNKQLQAAQQKLQASSVLSDEAKDRAQKEIDRLQVEIQRATQDAQAEVQDLQQELQNEFQRKLMPIIQQMATEKGLYMLFSQADAGIVWADLGLDITSDVIKRFNAATAGTAPKQQ